MDVQIYEVSKTDLLTFGNQIGTQASLTNLGGTTRGVVRGNGTLEQIRTITDIGTSVFGVALAVPAANLQAFQRRDNTKLLASTQIHAFNNEDSSARIGQRVPVQTASVSSFNSGTTNGQTGNNVFGTGFPVINYEQVGLTLKFKPIVFPNQDVQVTMEIESKDIVNAGSLTPTFTERTIKGTARVQNNKTLLLASVAQGVESEGKEGLPLLGMIPILGRLFSSKTRDNRQVDIVIAVTPRVIRAPDVLPEDIIERPTGSLSVPTSGSLSALLIREEITRQQNLALLNDKKRNEVPLGDGDVPAYVKSNGDSAVSSLPSNDIPGASVTVAGSSSRSASNEVVKKEPVGPNTSALIKPIQTNARTLDIGKALKVSDTGNGVNVKRTSLALPKASDVVSLSEIDPAKTNNSVSMPFATLQILPKLPSMKAGDVITAAILVKGSTAFRSAVLGFSYDESKVALRNVSFGDVFGSSLSQTEAKPFFMQNGKLYVSFSAAGDVSINSSGVLAFVEIEALVDGVPRVEFDPDMLNLLTADGNNFEVKF
jgi:hypothetical protein